MSATTPTLEMAGEPVRRGWIRRFLRYSLWSFVWLVLLLGGLVLGMKLTGLRIGIDVQRLIGEPACMPSLVYLWHKGLPRPPQVGDVIVASMPDSGLHIGARPGDRIVKEVFAVAGDHIRIQGTELWINGKHTDRLWLAKSLPGKKPGDFDAEYTLKDGQLFLMGTTQESLDSRYWGPVNRESIIGGATPLF
jgi:conjugal transfer pilin signal peptidase TrbI